MRATLLLAALVQPLQGMTRELGVEPEPTAVWWTIPAAVEVGEPFRWLLEVRHPAGALRELDEQTSLFAADLDPSWVLLEPEPTLALPDPERADWVRTRTGWRAVSLDSGERPLPAFEVVLVDGRTVSTPEGSLTVAGVLGAAEDEPRPARGFRELPPDEPTRAVATGAFVAGGLAIALLLWMWRRSTGGDGGVPELTSEMRLRTRLAELEDVVPDNAAEVRDLFFELSALVRDTVDERVGRDRRGLTDDEWLGSVNGDEALRGESRAHLERFLARSSEVKYAAVEPSPWAVRDELATVRGVLRGWADSDDDSEEDS